MNQMIDMSAVPLTMSSREIAELCEKEIGNVHRDIRAMLIGLYGEEHVQKVAPEQYRNRHSEYIRENGAAILKAITGDDSNWNHEQKRGFSWERDNRGYITVFHLDHAHTMTLVSGYNVKLRKAIIDRWQELEAKPAQPAIPQSLPEALRLAADECERANRAEAQLAIAAPKAQALDMISASDKAVTVTEAAKILGVKREYLTNWMHANGWAYRSNGSWVAYQQHINNGRLQYKEAKYTDDNTGQEVHKPYFHILPKGLTKLAQVFAECRRAA